MTTCDPHITIERYQKVYRAVGCPGYAWDWTYSVTVPGELNPFIGQGVGWARGIAARYSRTTGLPVDDRTKKA